MGILSNNKALNYPRQKYAVGIQTRNPIALAVENLTIVGFVDIIIFFNYFSKIVSK
jgi:hypothetical protein